MRAVQTYLPNITLDGQVVHHVLVAVESLQVDVLSYAGSTQQVRFALLVTAVPQQHFHHRTYAAKLRCKIAVINNYPSVAVPTVACCGR